MRTVRSFTVQLAESWTLLMHTDGISPRADIRAVGLTPPWHPETLARAILDAYGRQHDDALAVVAMSEDRTAG
jgi:hypothetical protein